MSENWSKLLGKRVLVRDSYSSVTYSEEAVVVEVSPSKQYVKFRWPSGAETWRLAEDKRLTEVLKPMAARQSPPVGGTEKP